MEENIWKKLSQPIVGLSPMDGVTDVTYRTITKKYGNPDVIYTEFTSVEGVCHGATRLLTDFLYNEEERPIIAQIFGATPDNFRQTAVVLCELGFDGIDINMGCPAKSMHKSGSGACLIQTPETARDIIQATKQGVEDFHNGMRAKDCPDIMPAVTKVIEERARSLEENRPDRVKVGKKIPVSVKTRIGFSRPVVSDWIAHLLECKPAAIAIHGRTLKQGYQGSADWQAIGEAVEAARGSDTLILGNGDIEDRADAINRCKLFGTHGALIGRASFGNPFVFLKEGEEPSATIYGVALDHAQLFEKTFPSTPDRNNFLPMRKHLGWYVKGIDNASDIRRELFRTNNSQDVADIFKKYDLI